LGVGGLSELEKLFAIERGVAVEQRH